MLAESYFYFLNFFSFVSSSDPELSMTVPQMIQRWGYPVEQHEVTTEDGYILTVFRIKHGVNSSDSICNRPPIIMDHSLLCDSSEYVMNPPQSSPAMELADAGFDVFLINHRGSTYCRRHRDFNTSDPRFWKFTIDEHAKYDNPAVIDYVLNLTGEKSLYWLGHSQGAVVGFMTIAERPEYNHKIRALIQIAPATTAHAAKGFWRGLFIIYELFKPLHDIYRSSIGSHEVGMGDRTIPQMVMHMFCATPYLDQVCISSMYFGLGYPSNTFNCSRWPVYVTHLPASTSTWNLLHWGQLSTRHKLEHFDHNPDENLARYGQVTSPEYDLSRVKAPVHIFWSSADWLATEQDLEDLMGLLRKDIIKGLYEVPEYNHLDFVAATDNSEKVFNQIITIVRKQEKEKCVPSK